MTPLNLDSDYAKAISKHQLDFILNELADGYKTYLDNKDPIIQMVIDNRTMFKEFFDLGMTAADIKNEILEAIKQDPNFKNISQNMLQVIQKNLK